MKHFRNLGILAIAAFSFFYTEKIANLTLDKNELYQSIKEESSKYNEEYINAFIEDGHIVPGLNGKTVNIKNSFYNMKDLNAFNSYYLIYDTSYPEVTIENKKEDKKEDKTTATTPTSQITTTIKKKETQIAKPSRVVKLKIKKSSKRSVKISWKKQKNASGYEVYRSTKKNKSFKKITTLKKAGKVTYVNKKLKKGKTYYYKVRAYKVVSGKKVYGKFSTIKKIKIKK